MNHLTPEEFEKAVALRHDLHMNPELSRKEYRTSEKIREFLEGLPGCTVLSLPVDTGVVARIGPHQDVKSGKAGDKYSGPGVMGHEEGGNRPMDSIARNEVMLRADIDALPQTEQADIPWKSRVPGVMHACGHDLHTAALCGAALALSRLWSDGKLDAAVDLVFQPAEEGTTGARELIDAE